VVVLRPYMQMIKTLNYATTCSKVYLTRYNVTQFIYFCKLLYIFRMDPTPIIRSTKLYLQHLVLVKPLLLPVAIAEELSVL